jgi:ferredoxin-NADP reductase
MLGELVSSRTAERETTDTQRRLVVAHKENVTAEVVALTLAPTDGQRLPAWTPGAHVELVLPASDGPLRRQYSLCGDPDGDEWRIAVLREPEGRGGSAYVHEELEAGDLLTVNGPRNHFELRPSEKYLFIAGGIGITPILAMVHRTVRDEQPWQFVYCTRTEDRVVFSDALAALPAEHVTVHLDERDGLLDLETLLAPLRAETSVYACGPLGLLRALEKHAENASWHFYYEQFKPDDPPTTSSNSGFEVVLAGSGQTYQIRPEDSILDVLNADGADIPYSCSEGICGTCETGVLEGIPEHRDKVLTPEEKDENICMMVCVSRAKSARLVLDL